MNPLSVKCSFLSLTEILVLCWTALYHWNGPHGFQLTCALAPHEGFTPSVQLTVPNYISFV